MSLCNIGKTVKDEVKLCYLADEYLLNSLAQIQDHRQEDGFILFRATSEFFRHCFTVHWGEFENHSKPIARMYFGHTGNMYEKEISSFANAIINDTAPEITAEDGIFVQNIVEKAYLASQEGVYKNI